MHHTLQWVDCPRKLAAMVDIMLTALPAPPDVKILMEDTGVLDAMRPGTIWIAHETTIPEESERFGIMAKSKGIHMLEAPLTGAFHSLPRIDPVLTPNAQRIPMGRRH